MFIKIQSKQINIYIRVLTVHLPSQRNKIIVMLENERRIRKPEYTQG